MTQELADTRRRYVSLPYRPKPTERVLEIRRHADRGCVEVILAVELPQVAESGKMDGEVTSL